MPYEYKHRILLIPCPKTPRICSCGSSSSPFHTRILLTPSQSLIFRIGLRPNYFGLVINFCRPNGSSSKPEAVCFSLVLQEPVQAKQEEIIFFLSTTAGPLPIILFNADFNAIDSHYQMQLVVCPGVDHNRSSMTLAFLFPTQIFCLYKGRPCMS